VKVRLRLDYRIDERIIPIYKWLGDRFRLDDIVRLSGMAPSSVYKNLKRMERYGLVIRETERGRTWIKRVRSVSQWVHEVVERGVSGAEEEGKLRVERVLREVELRRGEAIPF